MDAQQSLEQVAGILHRGDLQFDTRADGKGYRLAFGSCAVFVETAPWKDGSVVTVTSPVLQDIDEEGAGGAGAINRLAELNRRHRFLKFVFLEGDLVAVADLLGDHLQAGELLNVVCGMAAVADSLGPELAEELGGLTYEQWLEECDSDRVEPE